MLQHITYNEWLPIILGPRVLEIFELKLMPTGFYNGYNDTVNPTISNSFAAAAFRFGHSLVKNTISRCSKQFSEVPFFIKLHKELNNPSNLHNFGSVDRLMFGLIHQKIARRDEFIASELTNHLFQVRFCIILLFCIVYIYIYIIDQVCTLLKLDNFFRVNFRPRVLALDLIWLH